MAVIAVTTTVIVGVVAAAVTFACRIGDEIWNALQ